MPRPLITVFDYGVGNLHSLCRALEVAGFGVRVSRRPGDVLRAAVVALPGVGGFARGARKLRPFRLELRDRLREGTPCLAVCLGMQLLYEASEEAPGEGIGLLRGVVRRLDHRKLPHVGWSPIRGTGSPIFAGIPRTAMFYFVHSFAPSPCGEGVIASCEYGRPFAAAVRVARTWGFQFHPEKSSLPGLQLLKNVCKEVRPGQ